MPSILKAALPALFLAVAPLVLPAQQVTAPAPNRTIQVVGEGRATAAPDMARISLGVSHQASPAVLA